MGSAEREVTYRCFIYERKVTGIKVIPSKFQKVLCVFSLQDRATQSQDSSYFHWNQSTYHQQRIHQILGIHSVNVIP